LASIRGTIGEFGVAFLVLYLVRKFDHNHSCRIFVEVHTSSDIVVTSLSLARVAANSLYVSVRFGCVNMAVEELVHLSLAMVVSVRLVEVISVDIVFRCTTVALL